MQFLVNLTTNVTCQLIVSAICQLSVIIIIIIIITIIIIIIIILAICQLTVNSIQSLC